MRHYCEVNVQLSLENKIIMTSPSTPITNEWMFHTKNQMFFFPSSYNERA